MDSYRYQFFSERKIPHFFSPVKLNTMRSAAPAPALISLAILALTLAVASAQRHIRERATSSSSYLTKEEHWMNQTIDHFSPYVSSFSLYLSAICLIAGGVGASRCDGNSAQFLLKFSIELQCVLD